MTTDNLTTDNLTTDNLTTDNLTTDNLTTDDLPTDDSTGSQPQQPDTDGAQRRYVNPLVEALVDDPAEPPDLVAIRGYMGPADDPRLTRLYLDPTMNAWRDVPIDQIEYEVHVKAHPAAPFGEDVVWVSRRNSKRIPVERTTSGLGDDLLQLAALRQVETRAQAREPLVAVAEPVSSTCPSCGANRVVRNLLIGDEPDYGSSTVTGTNVFWPPR